MEMYRNLPEVQLFTQNHFAMAISMALVFVMMLIWEYAKPEHTSTTDYYVNPNSPLTDTISQTTEVNHLKNKINSECRDSQLGESYMGTTRYDQKS